MSSCKTVNDRLARALMVSSSCRSVSGPTEEVNFADAAIFWASFYHLAFSEDIDGMKGEKVRGFLKQLSGVFGVPVAHYGLDGSSSEGFRRYDFP